MHYYQGHTQKLKLIEKIIVDDGLKEAEVILDVEVLEIDRTNTQTYGWDFQPGLSVSGTIQNPTGQRMYRRLGLELP